MTPGQAIRAKIAVLPEGEPFTPALFKGLGSPAVIRRALAREVNTGTLKRFTRGVYYVPKPMMFGIQPVPSVRSVVALLAPGETIGRSGAQAAQMLGFSTQMVVREVFVTSGRSRRIRYGKTEIFLKHVCARKLALGTGPAGLALLALWYLGRHEVTPQTFVILKRRLSSEDFQRLTGAASVMPSWMTQALAAHQALEILQATQGHAIGSSDC